MAIDDTIKRFVRENVWAIGFGVLNGATGGEYTDPGRDMLIGAGIFGVAFPAFYKIQGHHRTWESAALTGVKGAASYAAAYSVTRLLLYQHL